MTRDELLVQLAGATPEVPATDDVDTLCRTAAAMLDARDAILARVPTLAGTIDPVKLADLEARDRRWSAALAGHLTRVGEMRSGAAKLRGAYGRQNPRR